MKNKLLIIIISILLSSCKSDDSPSNNNTEKLIGQWEIVQRNVNGVESLLGECEPFAIYSYNEDGTYSELLYAAVLNSECLDNPSVEFTGTWLKNSDNSYSFTNSNNITSEFIIEFISNDSFTSTFSEFTNSNDPLIGTVVERFNRIQ